MGACSGCNFAVTTSKREIIEKLDGKAAKERGTDAGITSRNDRIASVPLAPQSRGEGADPHSSLEVISVPILKPWSQSQRFR